VSVLCRVLNVNRSTYYKFINRKESKRELENKRIRRCILDLYAKSDKRLGAEKITLCLKRDYRINISVGRVRRLMKGMNLPKMSTVKPPKFKAKSGEDKCENILCQRFEQTAPNLVWVSDFTYLKAGGKFYYLCAVMDLYSRKIIAYKLSDKINTQLAVDTVDLAVANRGKSNGIIFHTDRGSQYTSKEFRKHLDNLNIIQSFSAKGHPYDNAVMECFFKYLKKEETNRRSYSSLDELKISIFKYIFGFYNSTRPHSNNGGLSPDDFENL